jgi:long-subunit fatty acid transport protein
MAMGGINQGIYNPFFVNPSNPASYTAFDTLSFVFDVSMHGRLTNLSTTTQSQSSDYASLGSLLFGFPVTGKLKASFGLMPFSATGYKMTDNQIDTVFGNYSNIYEGNGGINQFYAGASYKVNKNLSIGINVAYLFGSMNHVTAVEFPETAFKFNSKTNTSTKVHDIAINYGIMYHKLLESGYKYTIGASVFNETGINATIDEISYTYIKNSIGVETFRDELSLKENVKETITLPTSISAGFSFGKGNNWLLGSDFTFKQWENFKFSASPESLVNNMQFGLGGFYNPSTSTVSSYFNRVTYRGGIRYSNGFLELRNQRIDEFGISFGIGLPLPRTSSTINFAVELGSRGTEKENLINENYVKFTLGLSIFERWFVIRKYE